MTTEALLAVCAILTCIGAVVAVIYAGGKQVGRVETIVERLTGLDEKVAAIPELVVKVEILEGLAQRNRSDYKELAMQVAHVRGKLSSVHEE